MYSLEFSTFKVVDEIFVYVWMRFTLGDSSIRLISHFALNFLIIVYTGRLTLN